MNSPTTTRTCSFHPCSLHHMYEKHSDELKCSYGANCKHVRFCVKKCGFDVEQEPTSENSAEVLQMITKHCETFDHSYKRPINRRRRVDTTECTATINICVGDRVFTKKCHNNATNAQLCQSCIETIVNAHLIK